MKMLLWCQSEVLFTAEVHTQSFVNVSKKCMFGIRTCKGTVTSKHQNKCQGEPFHSFKNTKPSVWEFLNFMAVFV